MTGACVLVAGVTANDADAIPEAPDEETVTELPTDPTLSPEDDLGPDDEADAADDEAEETDSEETEDESGDEDDPSEEPENEE